MKKTTFTLICLLLAMAPCHMEAQISIGSNSIPVTGALLQLKEKEIQTGANATQGLGMPRVKLTSKTNLFPMFEQNGANYKIGTTNYTKADEDAKHIGLMVYHADKCSMSGAGVYAWDGAMWKRLPYDGNIGSIFANQYNFEFASGLDARGTTITPQTLTMEWNLAGNLTYTTAASGVPFAGANALPASPWITSPASINLKPNAMTASDVTAANPWKSKETKLTFVDADCGSGNNRTITINQTNYAIQSFNNAKGKAGATNSLTAASDYIRLTDATSKTFLIKTNATWKTTISNPKNILIHTIAATGGADKTDGTTVTSPSYTLTGIAGSGTKYQTATITIEDTSNPKRAKDVIVTCLSCIGTDAGLATLQTATPAQTSGGNIWGTKVILHQAKAGVYEQFTSADFGAAGRWMTTNLSAKAYDGVTHSEGRALTGPNCGSSGVYNNNNWAYPSAISPTTATEYNTNKSLGLLYTWDAATAGKGGSTGQNGANESGVNHANPQGICPAGWHLPSDYEWTQLENVIIQNTSQYSSLADISPSNANTLTQNTTNSGAWRSQAHGTAMKEVCETVSSMNPAGASNPASQGGFSAPLVGFALNGSSYNFGSGTYFWCSSSHSTQYGAWKRDLSNTNASVNEFYCGRDHMLTVRCKKNEVSVKVSPSISQQYVKNGTDYATPLTTQLTATVLAADTTNKSVIWTSADPSIATVNASGLVTSVKNGRTTITATTVDGGFTSTAGIVVGCGAYTAANIWTVFMCHNLGADTSKDPLVPIQAIHGDYYQWGVKAAVATAFTAPDVIAGWNTSVAADKAWNSSTEANPVKTGNDPCPKGYRIPTYTQWASVIANNTTTSVGTWLTYTETDHTKFDVGRKLGDYLFLPAAGSRYTSGGALLARSRGGFYWSSTEADTFDTSSMALNTSSSGANVSTSGRPNAISVRCVSE